MPQVSVIIPTRNRASYLAGAVRSVLAQSFTDTEIIVVDDCSDDNSATIVAGFGHPQLRYVRHDRQRGGAAARNTGVAHSSGEYIAFLDDDDEWYPEKLARQVSVMRASPPEIGGVYTGYFIVDRSDGQIRGQIVPTERGNLAQMLLAGNCIGSTSSMLLRRSCLDTVGGFDERLPSFQDYDLWLRLAHKYQFECIRVPMLKYFVHGEKIWTNPQALIQGLELMLKKYGYAAPFRKKCATYYLNLGVQYCEANRFAAGRKAFLRATRLNPRAPHPYVYLALALMGGECFRRARQARARLLPSGNRRRAVRERIVVNA